MKSLVHTEELCSRSVPLEHAPGTKPLVCIGLYCLPLFDRFPDPPRIGFTIEFLTNIECFFFDILLWLVCLDPAHVSVSLKDLALHKVKCQSGP